MATAFSNTSAPAAPSPAAGSLLDRLLFLLNDTGDGIRRTRAQAELGRLDDRTLKDIGVHRTELSSILHHDLRDPSRRPR